MGMNNGFLGTNYDNFAGAVILDAVAESPTAAALAAARAAHSLQQSWRRSLPRAGGWAREA